MATSKTAKLRIAVAAALVVQGGGCDTLAGYLDGRPGSVELRQ